MNAYKLISLPLGADESRARFEVPIDSLGEVLCRGIDDEEKITVSDSMEEINDIRNYMVQELDDQNRKKNIHESSNETLNTMGMNWSAFENTHLK